MIIDDSFFHLIFTVFYPSLTSVGLSSSLLLIPETNKTDFLIGYWTKRLLAP